MSKAPSMPMYWDAYIADTSHLTLEEHGAYMLLLAAMWRRNGYVPDDDKDNARILSVTPAKWRKIKARLVATISGFHIENDEITQEKLLKTWEITQEKIAKNAANGAKGGRPKLNKNKDLAKANGSVSLNPNESIPEPEPEPESTTSSNDETDDASKSDLSEHRERLLHAMGCDPISGMHGPNGRRLGTVNDMAEVAKWHDAGLSEAEQLSVVQQVMGKRSNPPNGFAYFRQPMADLVSQKNSPLPLGEAAGQNARHAKVDRWNVTAMTPANGKATA